MNSKTVLGILLFISMIFVLYPSVTSLIDIQESIGKLGSVRSEILKTRDNLILQIIGFAFLYLVLAFILNLIKIEQNNPEEGSHPEGHGGIGTVPLSMPEGGNEGFNSYEELIDYIRDKQRHGTQQEKKEAEAILDRMFQKDTFPRPRENGRLTKPQQVIETKTRRILKPLSSRTKNVIAVFSASVFMLVFVWQVFSNISSTTSTTIDIPMFFIEQAVKALIACLIVGITAYIIAKYH